ncbi:MAG TPA: hypothetical protein VH913_14220 [Hyphomicrobiaceae bacterium]
MTISTPAGTHYIVHILPLHRRRLGRSGLCVRPTHWLAMAGRHEVVANTRRDALAKLKEIVMKEERP